MQQNKEYNSLIRTVFNRVSHVSGAAWNTANSNVNLRSTIKRFLIELSRAMSVVCRKIEIS